MAEANYYCATCDTHFGGPPNNVTIEEHIEHAHDGGMARVIEGTWRDWKRKHGGLSVDDR